MDTYVHIAAGAALGGAAYEWIKNQTVQSGKPIPKTLIIDHPAAVIGGIVVGLLSHVAADTLPHADYLVTHGVWIPNRFWPVREFLACLAVFGFIFFTLSGRLRWVVLLTGMMGGLPDLESLLIGTNLITKNQALFPTHNGTLPHGANLGGIGLMVEVITLLMSLLWIGRRSLALRRKQGL